MFFPTGFHVLNHNFCKEKNTLECLSHSALCVYDVGRLHHSCSLKAPELIEKQGAGLSQGQHWGRKPPRPLLRRLGMLVISEISSSFHDIKGERGKPLSSLEALGMFHALVPCTHVLMHAYENMTMCVHMCRRQKSTERLLSSSLYYCPTLLKLACR